ncbi:GGDEF domain-containing protein, partial [Aquitalea magnusonii]|uniref:GGDEF domain-containing protein n=1 Tax=Aquitalea magnusonii TaxID=332411 RepID=UPI0019563A79
RAGPEHRPLPAVRHVLNFAHGTAAGHAAQLHARAQHCRKSSTRCCTRASPAGGPGFQLPSPADQSKLWAIVSVELMPQQQIPAALIALYDISERKALENELEEKNRLLNEMAITDPLTRLSNRRHADQTLKEELQRCERYSQPMSVAVFDIDHFKQFNDSFGHQAGDNVLLAVANAAVDCTRSTDVCARIGGEEFLVIFPCTRLRDAEKVMARVQQVLAGTVFPFTDEKVTFSGGITAWRPGDTPSGMLSRADKLLYQAKMAGRDLMLSDGNPD